MPTAENLSTDQLIKMDQVQKLSTDDLIKAHQSEIKSARAKYTELESAGIGALDSKLMGFADEAGGVAKTAYDAIKDPGKAYDKGLSGLMDSYRQNRSNLRAEMNLSQKDNPMSYLSGQIGGAIIGPSLPGLGWMNIAKDASFLQKMKVAAGVGGLAGAGTSNADLTKGELVDLAKDASLGAVTGLVVQGALSRGGKEVNGAVERFKTVPESRAVKAVTGQNISALRQISNTTFKSPGDIDAATNRIVKVGRDILDEPGVLNAFSKVEDMAPKLGAAREKYGQLIGDIGTKIDELAPGAVDAKNIAQKILDYAEKIPTTEAGKKLQTRLGEEAANFEQIGNLGFIDAQKFKNQFKYKAVDADSLISNQDATNTIRNIISKEMDKTAENLSKVGNPEIQSLLGNYKLFKSKYGSFKAASDAATDRVQKNLTNRFVSPSDYGIGSVVGLSEAITHGGPSLGTLALGAGAAAANKFSRERGSAFAAKTAEAIINTYKSEGVQALIKAAAPIIDLAKRGNPAAILTFQILNESNPKAVEILNQSNAMQRRQGQ